MEPGNDGADEGRFPRSERAAERDDVAQPQRASETARELLERGAIVEDVIGDVQNSVWCFCA
ncbi:MAG TPA: hypothetical protein VGC96_04715 [Candidatus Elarobacter sp.]